MVDLKKFVTSQLLDIIQWQDDSRDTVSWLFPDEDKEIKNGAQLIVRTTQIEIALGALALFAVSLFATWEPF